MSFFNGNTSPATPGGIFPSIASPFCSNMSAQSVDATPTPFGTPPTVAAATLSSGFGRFGGATPATKSSLFSSPIGGRLPAFKFESAFGTPAAVTTVTPGLGATNLMLGQQQQQQPVPMSADEECVQFIRNVSIFGDERDNISAKWNYLQAMWGTGKLYYSQSAPPLDITQQNPLCCFKTIGYSHMPGQDNNLGLVALIFYKDLATVKIHQPQIIQMLLYLMGNNTRLTVHIEMLRELDNTQCQMVIYVVEKLQVLFGPYDTRRIPATELANYLAQTNVKPYLDFMGIIAALALTQPDEEQLKQYLGKPPSGIDPRLWHQANLDNPEPRELIPVPIIGFNDLQWRLKCQDQETDKHELYLKKVGKEVQELQQRQAYATAKINENKRKIEEISQRMLQLVVKQEYIRRVDNSLTYEEEALLTKLENLRDDVSEPTEFEGGLEELLDEIREQRYEFASNGGIEDIIDKKAENELKEIITMQQGAIELLLGNVDKDLEALNIIAEGLSISDSSSSDPDGMDIEDGFPDIDAIEESVRKAYTIDDNDDDDDLPNSDISDEDMPILENIEEDLPEMEETGNSDDDL